MSYPSRRTFGINAPNPYQFPTHGHARRSSFLLPTARCYNHAMQDVTLRPATEQDAGFLYRLHRATLEGYVEQTYGPWDEEWQRRQFLQNLRPSECQIITFQGRDVGVVRAVDRETEVFLSVIEILPRFQGQGIGSCVIRSVLDKAHRRGKPVALQVLKVNPARRLYTRLGFDTVGETETHYQMRALPPEGAGSPR